MRALIVDDSRFVREYSRQVLFGMGVACEEARNGQEALAVLKGDKGFDLMLLDMNMPVMNGIECVKELRESGLSPNTKVMMVTTESESEIICQALDLGADEFLMKPFTADGLREKMSMLGLTTAV
jgi:two-component system chemotaxis response regulator CheY